MRRARVPSPQLLLLLAVLGAGCGQKGPLYLPDETPATEAPAGDRDAEDDERADAERKRDGG
jgi:predicted small lipoprotein YifL